MNARLLLLLAALIPAGLLSTSCSFPHEHDRTALIGGLGPHYKYRASKYASYEVSPYVPNAQFNDTKTDNYFAGRYRGNNGFRLAPLVSHGNTGKPTVESYDTLHYHTGGRYYGGTYAHGNLYRHSHDGFRPHDHDVTPDEAQ